MMNANMELLLSEYFLTKAILGNHLVDGKELFHSLSKIFLLSQEEVRGLYELAENQSAREIDTVAEYFKHERVKQYAKMEGLPLDLKAEWEEVVRIKGNAFLFAKSHELLSQGDEPRSVLYARLTAAQTAGLVCALRIVGILQCEGIFLGKNLKVGLKNLSRTARWNDVAGILAQCYYDEASRRINMARLRCEIADSPYAELYDKAVETYGESDAEARETRLLDKAFTSSVMKREVYSPMYARILYGDALSLKDKERVIFAPELAGVVVDLPLKLSRKNTLDVDLEPLKDIPLRRLAEIDGVARALSNCDLRGTPNYRPLCLCCDSRYVLDTYAKAIATKTQGVRVEVIDVAELRERDLDSSLSNVVLRSIDEDKDNRVLLYFCGDISEWKWSALKDFLQGDKRAKFYVGNLGVALNLSSVLPICFCDERNARALRQYCDVIKLSEVTKEETPYAVEDILSSKAREYGVGELKLEGSIEQTIEGWSIDTFERLVDSAARYNRGARESVKLTREDLRSFEADARRPRMGFGGYYNGRD